MFKAIGIILQCKPNITSTCHNPPIIIPAIIGLKSYINPIPAPSNCANQVVTGPITKNANGRVIIKVSSGTINIFKTVGICFWKNFSNFAPKNDVTIIGITLEV